MKKRLTCLFMALIMVLSLVLTSCSKSEEKSTSDAEEDESIRQNIVLTIYGVTDESTTDEGIAAVEKKVSEYCVAKYKTAIDLRLFRESEYEQALKDMYVKFSEEDDKKAEAEAEAEKAKKEELERIKSMTVEEKREYQQQQRLAEKEAKEKAKKEAEELKKLIEEGRDEAKVKEIQMDIIYIPDYDTYNSEIKKSRLTDISSLLNGRYKEITNFVHPSFIYAVQKDNAVYGIPVNAGIENNESYFVINKNASEEIGIDWSKIRSITDLEPYFDAAKSKGLLPISGDFMPENVMFVPISEDIDNKGFVSCFFGDFLPGGGFETTMMNRTYNDTGSYGTQFLDFCALKARYRASGILGNADAGFLVKVGELSLAEKKEWESKGYEVRLYKGAEFTTEQAYTNGLFGISSRCEYPERAMEILKLMYTDAEFHNLLTYGVKDVNYIEDVPGKTVTMITDEYSMSPFKTGNALLGYVPSSMDSDYVEYAKSKNLNSIVSPMLGFVFDDGSEDAEKVISAYGYWMDKYRDKINQILYGVPNYMNLIKDINTDLSNKNNPYNYEDFINVSKRKTDMVNNIAKVKEFFDQKIG